jgi:hypothetical protein
MKKLQLQIRVAHESPGSIISQRPKSNRNAAVKPSRTAVHRFGDVHRTLINFSRNIPRWLDTLHRFPLLEHTKIRNNRCYEIQSRYARAQAGSTEATICRVLLRFGHNAWFPKDTQASFRVKLVQSYLFMRHNDELIQSNEILTNLSLVCSRTRFRLGSYRATQHHRMLHGPAQW